MSDILVYIVGILFAFSLGFVLGTIYINKIKRYAGTIVVTYDEDLERLLYSMELDTDPNDLQYEHEVTFRIDASGNSPDRE